MLTENRKDILLNFLGETDGPVKRDFLTDKDMMDCQRMLVKKGLWIKFHKWARNEFCKDFVTVCDRDEMEAEFNNSLFCPASFAELIVEFREEEEKKGR